MAEGRKQKKFSKGLENKLTKKRTALKAILKKGLYGKAKWPTVEAIKKSGTLQYPL
jgi:hypothetical protein